MATAIILTIVFVVLVVYGLDRNARRQIGPRPPLTGSPNTPDPDRDLQRVRDELAALSGHHRAD